MADSSQLPQPHTPDCPGCAVDRTLTAADKAFLATNGWEHPGHTLVPPPELGPPPNPTLTPGRSVLVAVVIIMFAVGVVDAPTPTLVCGFVVGMGVLAARVLHLRHREPGSDRCRWCKGQRRRAVARAWAHYRQLAVQEKETQERRAHAANYARLLEQERKRRERGEGDQP